VEGLARSIGTRWKVGPDSDVVQALLTRNVVAGHPIGSRVRRVKYHHFHDRISLLDPGLIRFMSFNTEKPEEWTGGTSSVSTILESVAATVRGALQAITTRLSVRATTQSEDK
jgi:hypothetical protein